MGTKLVTIWWDWLFDEDREQPAGDGPLRFHFAISVHDCVGMTLGQSDNRLTFQYDSKSSNRYVKNATEYRLLWTMYRECPNFDFARCEFHWRIKGKEEIRRPNPKWFKKRVVADAEALA